MAESLIEVAKDVVVHPLVLLSVVDHYNRVAKDSNKRVVGVLLGSKKKNIVDITNSYAVPFEEDLKNPSVWFLDHNFLEAMHWMFRKVNNNETIVGFYSSGPKVKENDLSICDMFKRFCEDEPIFVVIDIRPGVEGLPTTAYVATEELEVEGKEVHRVFKHLSSSIEAEQAEGVGVEHLVRDINDPTTSTLALQIRQKVEGLGGLFAKLTDIRQYLTNVQEGKLPINNKIVYNLQEIFNLLPNLNLESLSRSLMIRTNDIHLSMYVSALVRSVIALHHLLVNKIEFRDSYEDVLDGATGDLTSSTSTPAPHTAKN